MLLIAVAPTMVGGANTVDYVAAIVNDSVITFGEVAAYTEDALKALQRTYGYQPKVLEQRINQTMQDGLQQLVERQLILDEFKSLGGRLPDTIIEDEIKERIRKTFGDRAKLTRTLKAQGITLESYRKRIHDEIIVEYMQRKNISSAILISPQKIETFYQTNLPQFQMSDQVKLRMIVLAKPSGGTLDDVRSLGREIIRKLDEGATFEEMAAVYSEGSARRDAGDWGWVDTNRLNRGLSEIAFSLKGGERTPLIAQARDADAYWIYQFSKEGAPLTAKKYSDKGDLIETRSLTAASGAEEVGGNGDGNGNSSNSNVAPPPQDPNSQFPVPPQEFYLMYVEDRRTARTRTLAEVRDEIEKNLTSQERTRLHNKWIDRLKAKGFVRTF